MKLPTVKASKFPLRRSSGHAGLAYYSRHLEASGNNPNERILRGCDADLYGGRPAQSVTVSPNYIFVQPQPQLTLDYFLPAQVYGQDPITLVVRPFPFNLGVRITQFGIRYSH